MIPNESMWHNLHASYGLMLDIRGVFLLHIVSFFNDILSVSFVLCFVYKFNKFLPPVAS